MTLRWLFRVATHPRHGGGHISRCLAIADCLKETPLFICDEETPVSVLQRLQDSGVDTAFEYDTAARWAGTFVDGYDLMESVPDYPGPRIVFLDYGAPPPGSDMLIDTAFGAAGEMYQLIPALLGHRFLPLRSAYQDLPDRRIEKTVRRVLIVFGRRDAANMTGRVLALLRRQGMLEEAVITVVLGGDAPHIESVRSEISKWPENVQLKTDVEDMVSLYCDADLAIGAGGVGLAERAACGLPSITVSVAENQMKAARSAGEIGITVFAGSSVDIDEMKLTEIINDLSGNDKARLAMSKASRLVVDGKGAWRIADAAEQLSKADNSIRVSGESRK